MSGPHPAAALLDEMAAQGRIDAWKRCAPRGLGDVFQLARGPYGVEVRLPFVLWGWPEMQARALFDEAANRLDVAIRNCVDQPAAECATVTPRKVPDLFSMPLPKGYRWPMTRFMGKYKPGPSLQISMLGLYFTAQDAYRRTGSMRRLKRDLVAFNIALRFDQRLSDAALYATRSTSAERVRSRVRGICDWRSIYNETPGDCKGTRPAMLWDGEGPLCWQLTEREAESPYWSLRRGGAL